MNPQKFSLPALFLIFVSLNCFSCKNAPHSQDTDPCFTLFPPMSFYLTKDHLNFLKKQATTKSDDANEAREAVEDYYRWFVQDSAEADKWTAAKFPRANEKASRLKDSNFPPEYDAGTLFQMAKAARDGSARHALELAQYYRLTKDNPHAALVWMEVAEKFGSLEAGSEVVKLRILVGSKEIPSALLKYYEQIGGE